MMQQIDEKIIDLFTNIAKNINHKDDDIVHITKDYMSHIQKDLKFTNSLLRELILKNQQNAISTTQEWFIETLGLDYLSIRNEFKINNMLGTEMSLTKFINELPIVLMCLMCAFSVEKKEWSIEKIRYISILTYSQIFQTTTSTICSFLIVINQYFYNKIHNIEQNENVVYDCVFETISHDSPQLLSY